MGGLHTSAHFVILFPRLRRFGRLRTCSFEAVDHNRNVDLGEVRRGSVLVVDDEPAVVSLVSSILTANGYTVISANSGVAALEQIRGREADLMLLITDVVMPDLNGPHLAEQLVCKSPSLRVLFMSGWEPNVIAHEGAFRRGYRTLAKPFTAAGLLETVQMVLQEPAPHSRIQRHHCEQ